MQGILAVTMGLVIAAHWKLTKAADNVPLAFDGQHELLFIGCRKPGMLIALDAESGKEVTSVASAGQADDLFYDSALHRLYLISGAGEVDSYLLDDAKILHPIGVLHTAAGAKTALFVPAQGMLYVGIPGAGDHAAEIRVYATASSNAR